MRSIVRNLTKSNALMSTLARGQGMTDLRDIDGVLMSAAQLTQVSSSSRTALVRCSGYLMCTGSIRHGRELLEATYYIPRAHCSVRLAGGNHASTFAMEAPGLS